MTGNSDKNTKLRLIKNLGKKKIAWHPAATISTFRTLAEMGDTQLYDLEICRRTSDLSEKSSVTQLQEAYVDCQITAKKFYCIDFGSGSAKDYFTKEYSLWGTKYAFWTHPGDRNGQLGSSAPECDTPVDCYQQAVQKLTEARQEIQNKADKSELSTVKGEVESLQNAHVETINCRDVVTPWNDSGFQYYTYEATTVFLDRHNIICGDNEQLTRWQLKRDGNNIRFEYKCCQGKIEAQGLGRAIIV